MKLILKIILISLLLSPIIAQAENAHPVMDNPLLDFDAIYNASAEEIQSLINQGYDVNEADDSEHTILRVMVARNRIDIVTLLVKAGANVNQVQTVLGKNSTLHSTAYDNYPEIAQILIDAGADIETKNKYEKTPLHEAARQGSVDAMRILLQAGADPNARTKNGGTALMGAVSHAWPADTGEGDDSNYTDDDLARDIARSKKSIIASLAMLKLLVEYGADPHAVNNDNNNARDSLNHYLYAPNIEKYLDELGVK